MQAVASGYNPNVEVDARVVFVPAGTGKHISVLGQSELFLQSDADLSVFVNELQSGMGVPMHIHHSMDEMAYVLGGRVKVVADTESVEAGPGDYFLIRRGVPHGFIAIGTETARLLWITRPGNYDTFFEAISALPLGPDGPDFAAMAQVAAQHGTELVGPPPTA